MTSNIEMMDDSSKAQMGGFKVQKQALIDLVDRYR
jgi:magnesium-transporting ATPase (P-type)